MNNYNINVFLFSSALYLIAVIIGAIIRLYLMGRFKIKTIILISCATFIIGEIVLAYLLLFRQN